MVHLGYNAYIISTIVDHAARPSAFVGYNAYIISTIVDFMELYFTIKGL